MTDSIQPGEGDVVELLDSMLAAYPEDIWPTPPDARRAKDAAAADVMRQLAYPVFEQARTEIVRLRTLICDFAYAVANGEGAGRPWIEACRLMDEWGEEVPTL